MNKTFKNTQEMQNVLEIGFKKALRDVAKEMENKIHDEIVDMGIGDNSGWYQSTGEFADAWRMKYCERITDSSYKLEVFYDPNRIRTHNSELGQHTSLSKNYLKHDGTDVYNIDEMLPDMIFQGSHGKWDIEGRDAWTHFINSMDKSFAKIMRESFAKQGIKLKTKENYRM